MENLSALIVGIAQIIYLLIRCFRKNKGIPDYLVEITEKRGTKKQFELWHTVTDFALALVLVFFYFIPKFEYCIPISIVIFICIAINNKICIGTFRW